MAVGSELETATNGANVHLPADTEIRIKYLSIGLWNKRSRDNTSLSALILHSAQQLVFLVDNTASPRVVRRGYKRYLRHLTAGSPFRSTQSDSEFVLAFEVSCKNICGIDYSNPLCLPGRLVLESKAVVKKEFDTRDHALEFYRLLAIRSMFAETLEPRNSSQKHAADVGSGISAVTEWRTLNPGSGIKFKVGQTPDKRSTAKTPTKRRSEVGQSPVPLKKSGSPRVGSPVGRRKTGPGLKERPERHSRLSVTSVEHSATDHSKRKRGEVPDDLQDTGSSALCSSRFDDLGSYSPESLDLLNDSPRRPSAQYKYSTITFNFDEPAVPPALKPLIEGDERLLKLYESGLPAWAIYAPQYGIWYRPWMRTVTYMLFVLLSCFSLVMGFYDLYKNVPYLDKFLRQYGSFPAAAIMQWLDEHLSFRLSILFAYLFGKSELAVQLLRYLGTFGAMCREALQPLSTILGPAFSGWLSSVKECAASIRAISQPLLSILRTGWSTAIGQPLLALGSLLSGVLLPILQALAYAGTTLMFGPLAVIQTCSTGLVSFLVSAKDIGGSMAGMLSAGARVAPGVSQSAQGVGSQVTWLYSAVRLEALEVVKTSFVKVVRALQTLARLCVHCGSRLARHRQTLELRLRRQGRKAKHKFKSWLPVWLVNLMQRLFGSRDAKISELKDPRQSQLGRSKSDYVRPKSAGFMGDNDKRDGNRPRRRSVHYDSRSAVENAAVEDLRSMGESKHTNGDIEIDPSEQNSKDEGSSSSKSSPIANGQHA